MNLTLSELAGPKRYGIIAALVVPRPIAWVTTLNANGTVNAAPFSFFNLVGSEPPLAVLGIGRRDDGTFKDTLANVRRTGECVINLVTEANVEQMNLTATDFPVGASEAAELGLATEPSRLVAPPRLALSPASFEAREVQTLLVGHNQVLLLELIAVFIRDEFVDPERLQVHTEKIGLVGRMQGGTGGYCRTRDRFEIERLTHAEWLKGAAGKSQPAAASKPSS